MWEPQPKRKEFNKVNILYISISFPKNGKNIYTDLAEELGKKNKITVLTAEEEKNIKCTELNEEKNFEVLRVKTGNIFNVNLIEKAISYITLQQKLKKAIKKYLKQRQYDLIIFMAPPVTLAKVVKYAMKKYNAKSYLMQKDIFPENALDLGILKKWNPAYYYFRYKEKQMYKIATKIGCMSYGNIEYIKKHNKFIPENKLELFPNTIKISEDHKNKRDYDIRKNFNIPLEATIAIYGGNFGKPQGISFILDILNEYRNRKDIFFIFSGKGTEKKKIFDYVKNHKIGNVITVEYMQKEEYDKILKNVDIGLIFLDYRFTIPNIPSRTLSYFEYSIPILAATDKNTDYKDIIVNQAKAGLWCESNNVREFKEKLDYLIANKEKRIELGINGRKFLEDNWTVEKSVKILEKI